LRATPPARSAAAIETQKSQFLCGLAGFFKADQLLSDLIGI